MKIIRGWHVAGKKKADAKTAKNQGSIVNLKGSEEFGAWLKRLAAHMGLPATNTLDVALKRLAEDSGFKEPMPRRQKK